MPSDDPVRVAFMLRDDIAALPSNERNARWAEHARKVDEFWGAIAGLDTTIILPTQ